ncbi:MAG TPA: FMN-binding protein [Dehalococcoidia bacterium]|nr:FMN-binding protein [Dehalococcoidia bacterium]
MARKLKANLVALGSAAIVAVYAIGYAWTEHASPSIGAATSTASGEPPAPDAATAIARVIAANPPSPGSPATQEGSGAPTYHDGTYNGSGSSRRGDISVALTIQNGKITGVKITRATTYYPTSEIASLPAEVVSRQGANVDFVSGATDSSLAFRGAVSAALSQARSTGSAADLQAIGNA